MGQKVKSEKGLLPYFGELAPDFRIFGHFIAIPSLVMLSLRDFLSSYWCLKG
jgi:hypothetical protein